MLARAGAETPGALPRQIDGTVLVAELRGRVAALAACRIEEAIELERPLCRLTALVVAEDARGRGIGSALVAAVEEIARGRDCERLVLSSGNWRPQAHRFYASLGFEETGRRFAKDLSRGLRIRS